MALVAALSTSAHALHSVNVGPLYNTGVNSNGLSLANGAIDQHWLVNPTGENTETPANTQPTAATSAFGFPIPPWLGDDHKSDWIAPNASLMGPNAPDGTAGFIYSTTFDVSSAGTITISGGAGADNGVLDVQINNGPLQAFSNPSGFEALDPFSITASVSGGVNTISFYVQNGANEGAGDGLTGFRAEFANAAPEPASLAIWGVAIAGGLLVARRRRKA